MLSWTRDGASRLKTFASNMSQQRPGTLPTTLVPEILGFSPQLLLDDIISHSGEAILQCVSAMQPFMQRWADARAEKVGEDWDGVAAVEQGLVAFQTLLESHTDTAFDFFEVWSLRNIFDFPHDLPIVVPHQQGLDLTTRPEEEAELLTEIEELRRQIENQRRLKRMYTKAERISRVGVHRSERRLRRLDYLANSDAEQLKTLPDQIVQLFESVASLPHADPSTTALQQKPDPGKRLWETGKAGYINWAIAQLISKSKMQRPSHAGSIIVGNAVEQASSVGDTQDIKSLLDNVSGGDNDEDEDMDTT